MSPLLANFFVFTSIVYGNTKVISNKLWIIDYDVLWEKKLVDFSFKQHKHWLQYIFTSLGIRIQKKSMELSQQERGLSVRILFTLYFSYFWTWEWYESWLSERVLIESEDCASEYLIRFFQNNFLTWEWYESWLSERILIWVKRGTHEWKTVTDHTQQHCGSETRWTGDYKRRIQLELESPPNSRPPPPYPRGPLPRTDPRHHTWCA